LAACPQPPHDSRRRDDWLLGQGVEQTDGRNGRPLGPQESLAVLVQQREQAPGRVHAIVSRFADAFQEIHGPTFPIPIGPNSRQTSVVFHLMALECQAEIEQG